MRFRDAMALRLFKSPWTGAAFLVLLPLALLWPRVPAQAGADDGTLEISVAGDILSLDARSVPLDRLLEGLAEAFDFTVLVRCGAADCPKIRGRLRGALVDILDWILHDYSHSRTYGPATTAGKLPKLRRLVVRSAEPEQAGQPRSFAGFNQEQDAGFADLISWANRGSRTPNHALREGGAERGHLGLAELRAPMLGQAALPSYRVTSEFGPRRDPVNGRNAWHQGVDFAAPPNTQVVSTAPGIVLSAGRRGGYGIMVEVNHGAGIKTRYAHLSRALVVPGQALAGGEPLGVIGASGRSTGRHLHFEVRIEDRPVDPMKFLNSGHRMARLDRLFPLGASVVNRF